MARKPRTPPPPRRVQAPKTRRPDRGGPSRRAVFLIVAALLLAAAVAAGAFYFLSGGESDEQSLQEAMQAAGCTFETSPAVTAAHIGDDNATPEEWNTDPPSSGPHFGVPVIWGEYEDPVQDARAVHNLEHGGVWISYGDDVPAAEIESIRRFYRDDPVAMLLSPRPSNGDDIVLAAWFEPAEGEDGEAAGVLAKCPRFDEDAFTDFREEYRFKSRERFPPDQLEPGE
ncbi:MAG TPA: DUF3105 domain-containing protein [Gaiellaceae bacterium]|nr:DUF3105 domain-containing protein [Gaiellaceae bacterium]